MLDVHLPHKPIHGISEFFLHLFTITVGLLIATQIESCMEWRSHVHLAQEARMALRQEIKQNLKELKDAKPGLKTWRQQIDADLKAMQRIQENPNDPKARHTNLSLFASGFALDDTAWRTAQSTGALAYMPYGEAQRYASIYRAQSSLLASEAKPVEDVAGIFGLVDKYHWGKSPKITREQASAVAEKLGQMEIHLATGDALLEASTEVSEAFLQNRQARTSFEESVH